jgi:hypothetical protein
MNSRATVLAACVVSIACCTLVVSSCNARRSKVVLYDQQWSRTTGIANLKCAPEVRDDCRKEALSDEVSFSENLLSAFETAPTCKDIEFVVDTGVASPSQETVAHLLSLRKAPHWRLRVDLHPRLMAQPFSLDLVGGGFKDWSKIGGESSATDMARFACEMSKSNGVVDYW